MSAFENAQAFHFQTQLSDGAIVVEDYYNLNNSAAPVFGVHSWNVSRTTSRVVR